MGERQCLVSIFSLEPLALPASGQKDLGRVIFDPKKQNIELFELIIKIQPVSSNTSSPLQPSRCKVFQSLRGTEFEVLCQHLCCCRVTIYPSFANKIKWVHSSKMILPKNVCWTVVLPNEVVNGIFPAPKSEKNCIKTLLIRNILKWKFNENKMSPTHLAPRGSLRMEFS